MNVKRLTMLRDALIEHAKNPGNLEFDLVCWSLCAFEYETADQNEVVAAARKGENFCGTTACACGLATTVPALRKAGMVLDSNGDLVGGFATVEAVFDLSREDSYELFIDTYYEHRDRTDPLAVADKITALLHTA